MRRTERSGARGSALLALTCLTLAACRAPEPRDAVEVTPVEPPEAWQADVEGTSPTTPLGEWWHEFADPRLDEVIEVVLAQNHDLATAAARVAQAQAQAKIAGASNLPTVSVGADGTRQRQNFVGLPIGGGGVLSSTSTSYGVSLDVSWELDLWGALDAQEKAAVADVLASRADLRGAHLSLAAQTVKLWFALAEAQLQLELAESRVVSFEQTTRIMRERYRNGRIEALDLHLAESQLSSARAVRRRQREQLERLRRQLEILMADYPAGEIEGPARLPELPGAIPVGLPSELLTRRPDLVASLERLRAADYRLFEARKELWPSLSLTASGGRRSAEIGDLLKSDFDVWSLAGRIVQPIFQGGRLEAGIDLADARVTEALETFGQTTLRAFSEVETALAVRADLEARREELADAARHAASAEEIAETRYLEGRHDILAVLTARRQSFDAESASITATRERLDARVDLYLALGGGFEDERDEQAEEPTTEPESRER